MKLGKNVNLQFLTNQDGFLFLEKEKPVLVSLPFKVQYILL